MASGIMDVWIAKIPADLVLLNPRCLSGADADLSGIRTDKPIALACGNRKISVKLRYRDFGEGFVPSMEVSATLAEQLKLTPYGRYRVRYDAKSGTLSMKPFPVNAASGAYLPGTRLAAGTISIGCELLSRLGIPDRPGLRIQVQRAGRRQPMRLQIPANLFDRNFRLSSRIGQAFRLRPGAKYPLKYDQRTGLLTISDWRSDVKTTGRA
jgi:hypothetical protein